MKKSKTRTGEWKYGIRKIRIEEVMLIAIFMLVSVTGVFLGVYSMQRYKMQQAATVLYEPFGKAFYLSDSENAFEFVIDFADSHENCTFYCGRLDSGGKAVYSSDPKFSYDLKSGDGFTRECFESGEPAVLLGSYTYASGRDIAMSTGEKTFRPGSVKTDRDGNELPDYRIAGVLKASAYSHVADDVVVFNMAAISADPRLENGGYVVSQPFVIYGRSEKATNALWEQFCAHCENSGVTVRSIELPTADLGLDDFFQISILNIVIIIFAVFAVVLSTVPITAYWAKRRFKEIAVKRLLGFGIGRIAAQIYLRLFALFNIGFFGAYLVLIPISKLIGSFKMPSLFSQQMLIAYAAALIFNLLTAVAPLVKCIRVQPGDALRRGGA